MAKEAYDKYMVPVLNFQKDVEVLREAQVGDKVSWGYWEADVSEPGLERISRFVPDRQSGKVLLISEFGLQGLPYNRQCVEVNRPGGGCVRAEYPPGWLRWCL